MTVPCSPPVSVPVAAPGLPDAPVATPGTADATADAFAGVLAALSGALGVPLVQLPAQPVTTDGPTAQGTVPGQAAEAPGAWVVATQRQSVPGIAPTTGSPADDVVPGVVPGVVPDVVPGMVAQAAPAKAAAAVPVAPAQATDGTEVRTARPAEQGAHVDAPASDPLRPAPAVDAGAPAVPAVADQAPVAPDVSAVQQLAPDVSAVQQVAPATAPVAPTHVEQPPGVGPAKHVQPAVLEAARGLRHEGGGRTSLVVRLDPPELGAVLVRLTVQHGRVDVQLRTPDLVARNDLQAQQYDVQQVLREQGFDLSSFDVTHGDVFPGNQGDSPDRGTPQRSRGADGRVDDHHPVTDDGPALEPSGTWL